MYLLAGLLEGQRAGAMWLVAGQSPYDEGRSKYEPRITTVKQNIWRQRKTNSTLYTRFCLDGDFISFPPLQRSIHLNNAQCFYCVLLCTLQRTACLQSSCFFNVVFLTSQCLECCENTNALKDLSDPEL